jgi:predicted metalloendopeptidase
MLNAGKIQIMTSYIDEIVGALGDRIDELLWMSTETKARARKKLDSFTTRIGYPDKWEDLSSLSLVADEALWVNIAHSRAVSNQSRVANINNPPDLTRWTKPTSKVNAYFNTMQNQVTFPAVCKHLVLTAGEKKREKNALSPLLPLCISRCNVKCVSPRLTILPCQQV